MELDQAPLLVAQGGAQEVAQEELSEAQQGSLQAQEVKRHYSPFRTKPDLAEMENS
jgi:hypothetical protein